jgi:hypothetical protein
VGTGRRRRSCGEAERGQVSMDREKQRGRERTEGCPGSRVTRQSSPRQQTRQGLDGDRRTGTRPRRTAVKLPRCAHRARERERGCSVGGTTERGRASECGRAPEKAQACGSVVGKRAVVGASTVESAGGSGGGGGTVPTGGAHGRESASEQASVLTSRARRTERASVRAQRELASIGRPHRAARGREGRERARDDADRRGPLVREGRTHGRGMTGSRWACWARIGFPFSWNF